MSRISAVSLNAAQDPLPLGAGRHSTGRYNYLERFAERFPNPQLKIERGRLKQGKAKHRAHQQILRGAA